MGQHYSRACNSNELPAEPLRKLVYRAVQVHGSMGFARKMAARFGTHWRSEHKNIDRLLHDTEKRYVREDIGDRFAVGLDLTPRLIWDID